jgi:hypothetical protein
MRAACPRQGERGRHQRPNTHGQHIYGQRLPAALTHTRMHARLFGATASACTRHRSRLPSAAGLVRLVSESHFVGLVRGAACARCVTQVVFLWCKDPENEPEKIEYVYATNPEPAQPPTSKLSRLSQLAASRRFSTHRTSQQTPRSDSKRRTSLRRTSQQQESTSNTPQQSHRKRGDSSLSASAVTVVSATDERPSALAESSA